MTARAVASLALLGLTLVGAAQVIPAGGSPQGPRTGMIVGQVVDATSGAPVPDAIVSMGMPRFDQALAATPKGRVMVDDEGRFFFSELPPGEYYLGATKEGYAPGEFGRRQASENGQLLTLGPGERRTDVKIPVWKHAIIAGTVVDEAGEPLVGVAVRALAKTIIAGRTKYGGMPYLVPSVTTDDRGAFRFADLLPATYVIVVPTVQTSVPVSIMTTTDATALRNELFWAGVYEVSPLGQPRTQQIGDIALMSLNTVATPPPVSPAGRAEAYRTTYYPSATTAGAATPIAIAAGGERVGLAITTRPVPAVRVSGRLVTPDGSTPPPMTLRLVGDAATDVATESRPSSTAEVGFEAATAMSDATGRFTLLGVPAGEYVLVQANSFLMRTARAGLPVYWISQRLTVGNADIADLAVTLRPALRIQGRFEFRSASGPPTNFFSAIAFETPFGDPGGFAAEIDRQTEGFSTVAAGGRFIIRAYEFGGWFVQSVKAGDVDLTDRVFDLQSDMTLVVTFTDRPAGVSGTVKSARGDANPPATVLVFPVDRARWSGHGRSSRYLQSVPASATGAYSIGHLPPGEYYAIAVESAATEGWNDPQRLEALIARATRFAVAAGDAPKTLDLTLAASR
jgi:protocatechuate 3,4-dioxygenase beta subunit